MRVIIIGCGISGLITGHALLKAGINDFIILERRPNNPVEQKGSVIALFQQTMRIFDQLDLLPDVEKLTRPLERWMHLDTEGKMIYDGGLYGRLERNHGHHGLLFLRRELMEVFYNRLPDREKRVLTDKKVVSIEQDEKSVSVSCADGSTFQGDVVIGCDGVYSVVRRLGLPGTLTATEKLSSNTSSFPSRAEYRGLFGWSPLPDGIRPRAVTETHSKDLAIMILADDDRAYWLVTDRKTPNTPDKGRYDDEDIEELVDRVKHLSVARGKKVTFGELWKTRGGAGASMYDFQENVAEKWYDKRVVIVGDAAHKMTPNLGQGGNHSIETVACLVNHLHELVTIKGKSIPTAEEIDDAFGKMQTEREAKVRKIAGLTGKYTRWSTFRTWGGRVLIEWVWPVLGDNFVADRLLAPLIKESIKLDFVEESNLRPGKVEWKYS